MNDLIRRKDAIEAFGLSENTRKYGGDHSGYNTMMLYEIQDTLESLPSVQPQQKWVPVTERLPLYGQDVLAVRTYGDGEKYQEVLMAHIAVWNEETGEKWWNATNITHWMPLPEPPKEE